ncbi:MAG: SDR family NAD(P)-dependent oxidoreductase, partial [Pseudomonadota bacterium]
MAGRLEGRVAIVTGAGSGIGERTAHTFAREGAHVVVADKNAPAAKAVAAAITDDGGRGEALTVDVADAQASHAMIDGVVERHGRIDVLVNNAGYGIGGTVVETSEADWDAIMAVNVKGVFLASKFAIRHMVRAGRGSIVNTASTTSKVGITNRAAYVTTKGAVAALTRAMALDHV